MNQGKLVFSQLMAFLPLSTFRRCVARHRGDHKVQNFTCMDQFLTMAFAQLTYRESLRDIEINLRAQAKRLYHMGLRCKTVSRNTLANANATRPWQIYADFAQHLIAMARPLYAKDPLAIDLDATVYAFEPEAASYATLCGNIFDNNLGQRVKAYCLGISDMPGLGEILLSSLETATSGHQVNVARATPGAPHTAQFPQGVVTRTLDALVYEDGLPCPTHIKIDVDGLEHAIIDGAARLLGDPRLRSVLIELDLKSRQHLDTMAVIEAAGFRRDEATFEKLQQKTTGGNALIGNIIFDR